VKQPEFLELALGACNEPGRRWLEEQCDRAALGGAALGAAFAAAGRKLGSSLVFPAVNGSAEQVPAKQGRERLRAWTAADAGRVALLLAAVASAPSAQAIALVEDLYYRGELGEKRAVLLALPFLPNSEACLELAVESCRTNVVSLFEAIACESSYPTRHFSELHFNQLVMKAIFIGVAVERIVGVRQRLSDTLCRMLEDYRRERLAAGRPVPVDVERLLQSRGQA
jgi:hypothetical protein